MDSQYLAVAFTRGDNKIIGKSANVTRIQQYHIASLFIAGGFHREPCYFDCFQNSPPLSHYISLSNPAKEGEKAALALTLPESDVIMATEVLCLNKHDYQ